MFSLRHSDRLERSMWTIISILFVLWSSVLLLLHRRPEAQSNTSYRAERYSWEGSDFPSHFPSVQLEDVLMVPEDTTHYKIYEDDGALEWSTLFPPGGGKVRLGPQNRTFELTMFHELRCLGSIRLALADQSFGDPINAQSLQECFNYLREMALCRADVTLENVLDVHHSVNHAYPHVCNDWTAVYDKAGWNNA